MMALCLNPSFLVFHAPGDFETRFSHGHRLNPAASLIDLLLQSSGNSHVCKPIRVHSVDAA